MPSADTAPITIHAPSLRYSPWCGAVVTACPDRAGVSEVDAERRAERLAFTLRRLATRTPDSSGPLVRRFAGVDVCLVVAGDLTCDGAAGLGCDGAAGVGVPGLPLTACVALALAPAGRVSPVAVRLALCVPVPAERLVVEPLACVC